MAPKLLVHVTPPPLPPARGVMVLNHDVNGLGKFLDIAAKRSNPCLSTCYIRLNLEMARVSDSHATVEPGQSCALH